MGRLFQRKVTKAGLSRTTRTLNKKTGAFKSKTTRVKPKVKKKK